VQILSDCHAFVQCVVYFCSLWVDMRII